MSSPILAKRVACTSIPLLYTATTIHERIHRCQRIFHFSAKDKALKAIPLQEPFVQRHGLPSKFMQSRGAAKPGESQQLNIREQTENPSFYQAVADIMKLREQYIHERALFVKGKDMLPLLLGLGAHCQDVAKLAYVSDGLKGDPTLPFRKTRNCRFCLDFDTRSVRRLEYQPFKLSTEEGFKRHDSGKIRHFDEVQNDLQQNSVLQALLVFKAMIINGMEIANRAKLEYQANKWVCTLFNIRTFTTPEVLGEPALEGVHSDGVDHTMTTFLGASNVTPNSAATFIHSMDETTGIPLTDISPLKLLARVQHSTLLDTLMVVDHERKHSLSAVYPEDGTKEATRDMLIFFTRRPAEKGHVSGSIDSLASHQRFPMEIPLFAPSHI